MLHSITLSKEAHEIAFTWSSTLLHYQIDYETKINYLLYYDRHLVLHLYDVTNFNQLRDPENAIVHVKSVSLKSGFWKQYDYKG